MTQTTPFDTLLNASKHAVSERLIENTSLIAVHEGVLRTEDGNIPQDNCTGGNGTIHLEEDRICAFYKGTAGSYDLRLNHPSPPEQANGITVRYRISGWNEIRYLAIGHNTERGFRHVKINNPSQNEWVTFSVGYEDLAYHLTNDWANTPPRSIKDIRVYMSGTPSDEEAALINVAWASIWLESAKDRCARVQYQSHPGLFEALKRYFQRCKPALGEHAELFLKTGACPMTGHVALAWDIRTPTPDALPESGTYRYMWHAMQPAISLLVYGDNNNVPAAIYAARDYINSWLEHSYFTVDPDTKYTWYDHGTAERLLAFLLMHEIGLRQAFDSRFMERLRHAMVSHAQLLESEVFYSRHQPTRYHNHAWFQDIALIAAGVALSSLPCASRWLNRAIERLTDQFNKLIIHDAPFSIFVENSIGYHHGVQHLVDLASELVQLSDSESAIPETAYQLSAWSGFLRYPDLRTPSQGDTFRKPNPAAPGDPINRGNPYAQPSNTVLPVAGYAVVKGNHDSIPFMLCMFATSLSKTHKHEDDLSITLFFDGIEWLLDPSFYSHDYTEEIPAFLRSARAHNRIVIDELKHAITPGSTRLLPLSDEGSVTGESDAYEGVRLTRSIKCGHESLSIEVQETISTTTPIGNPYLVFHCGEGISVSAIGNQITLSHPLSRYSLLIDLPTDSDISIFEGKSDSGDFHGIAGAGFMQHNATALLRIGTHARSFSWRLKAYL
jgi:hypothetical protein